MHLDQSNIANMYVAKHEPNLGLEEEGSSKTFQMRLTAVRVDGKKEAVDADKTVSMNANIMKEDIEKYAELTEVYTIHADSNVLQNFVPDPPDSDCETKVCI